ncbi:carboxylesterase/lipase family protein [Parapusillimonas sp. JC17]|uniref:carboxylesterase/lipase family protein n=1 Tax=Parapusillimonas sp. JC17 TaxID=3445768 RepID=UPI003FA0718D
MPTLAGPVVTLQNGKRIQGRFNRALRIFLGIPYAKPITNASRFALPQALDSNDEVFCAQELGQLPLQPARDRLALLGGPNCLNLNVWAPADVSSAIPLPVMVWIPGGGFIRCNANDALYDGANFANGSIVLVSINYRVGIDGFLHLPDAPANRGLLDIVSALQWIRSNIASFGGDPKQITVFGQSAGAGAIACLLGMPSASGLFHRAILQSPSTTTHDEREASIALSAIAKLTGHPAEPEAFRHATAEAHAMALARLSADKRLRQAFGFGAHQRFPMRPVVDGLYLPEQPIRAASRSERLPLSVLLGSNEEEARFYMVPNGEILNTTKEELHRFASDAGVDADIVDQCARRLDVDNRTPGEILCALQSEYFYHAPARELAIVLASKGVQVHEYRFAWRSPLFGGELGAAHGVELPFVFRNLDNDSAKGLIGQPHPSWQELATEMHHAWLSFAKSGNPGWPSKAAAGLKRFDARRYGVGHGVRPHAGSDPA